MKDGLGGGEGARDEPPSQLGKETGALFLGAEGGGCCGKISGSGH